MYINFVFIRVVFVVNMWSLTSPVRLEFIPLSTFIPCLQC